MVKKFSLTSSDRALETCELSFDVSVHNMFSTWEAGASVHILPATMVMGAVKFARESRLTLWTSVPSLAGMLRQIKALAPASMPDLRLTIFGGEPVPEGIVKAWQIAAPNGAIATLYGPTETTVFCTAQPVTTPVPLSPGRDVVAIGVPFANHDIMVLDEHDQPLPDGSPGEMAICGVQLAQGYLGAPELTAARFPVINGKRWYRSGDLGMRDASGVFHCLGRIDNQIKVLGYRVELEEIDAHLREVSGHALASAVAWPMDNGVAGGIVSFIGAARVDEAGVVNALRSRLPAYMLPSRVIALENMPINANGKVDRRALRGWLEAHAA
jgi:non-ribosomal peptide synthetase component F